MYPNKINEDISDRKHSVDTRNYFSPPQGRQILPPRSDQAGQVPRGVQLQLQVAVVLLLLTTPVCVQPTCECEPSLCFIYCILFCFNKKKICTKAFDLHRKIMFRTS